MPVNVWRSRAGTGDETEIIKNSTRTIKKDSSCVRTLFGGGKCWRAYVRDNRNAKFIIAGIVKFLTLVVHRWLLVSVWIVKTTRTRTGIHMYNRTRDNTILRASSRDRCCLTRRRVPNRTISVLNYLCFYVTSSPKHYILYINEYFYKILNRKNNIIRIDEICIHFYDMFKIIFFNRRTREVF